MYIKKKNIPIPFSSSWACIGLRWLLWAFVNLRWPSLAAVGLRGLRSNKKMKNKMYIEKKDLPMAQTTCLALFGPFFVFVGLHWPSLFVGCCGPALAVAFEMGWARVTGALTVTRTRTQGHPDP